LVTGVVDDMQEKVAREVKLGEATPTREEREGRELDDVTMCRIGVVLGAPRSGEKMGTSGVPWFL
jgi:hypothetical protein